MKVSIQRPGIVLFAVIALGPPLAAQAGMQLKPEPALAPPAAAVAVETLQVAKPGPLPRRGDRTAWTPCIRLLNAVALGAAVNGDQRQAIIGQCAN